MGGSRRKIPIEIDLRDFWHHRLIMSDNVLYILRTYRAVFFLLIYLFSTLVPY